MYAQWERHDAASLEHQRGVALAYDAAGGVSQVRLPQAQLECARTAHFFGSLRFTSGLRMVECRKNFLQFLRFVILVFFRSIVDRFFSAIYKEGGFTHASHQST